MPQKHRAMSAEHHIRKASDNEMPAVGKILGSAFTNDPILRWLCDADSSFYSQLYYAELQIHYRFHKHVFINESRTGAAMWLPPGISSRYSMGLRQVGLLLSMFRYGGLAGLRRGQILDEVVSPEHMKAPHYYLHAIGAHLDFQGRGIGSALLKSGVSICDENKMPAYLESSNERNNPLYERYGFEITKELQLPKNGPKLWLMERSAAI